MSDEKSKQELEYKLRKSHRDILERELKSIKSSFEKHTEDRTERSVKRRRENIYVLLAIGILGGIFSIIPPELLVIDQEITLAFAGFGTCSALFLLIKLNSVALGGFDVESKSFNKLDSIGEYLFAFSINGAVILFSLNILLNYIDIQNNLQSTNIAPILSVIASFMLTLLYRYKQQQRERKRVEQHVRRRYSKKEVEKEISDIIISASEISSKSDDEEILERFKETVERYARVVDEVSKISNIKNKIDRVDFDDSAVKKELVEIIDNTEEEIERLIEESKSIEEKRKEMRDEYEEIHTKSE